MWHIIADRKLQLQVGKYAVCCSSSRGHMIRIITKADVITSWMKAPAEAGVWLVLVVLERVTSRIGTGVEGGWQGQSLNCSFKLCPFIGSDNTLMWCGSWGGGGSTRETRVRFCQHGELIFDEAM